MSSLVNQAANKLADLKVAATEAVQQATTESTESSANASSSTSKADKQAKKDAKRLEKERKEAEKKAAAEAANQRNAPTVELNTPVTSKEGEAGIFGDLPLIQSQQTATLPYVDFSELFGADSKHTGKDIWLRARVATVRAKGKIAFLTLRRGFYTLQCVINAGDSAVVKDMVKYASKISPESIVDVYGTASKPMQAVSGVTIDQIEVQLKKLYVVNLSEPRLPFQLADASRPEPKDANQTTAHNAADSKSAALENAKPADDLDIRVSTDVRLDNRWIDLRTPTNHAIYRLQSRVGQYFRQFFLDQDFVEIHTPKIIPGVSEGGAAVFHLKYFNDDVCLAQSPQLYKQMAVSSDLTRVFEIGPVFRAEDSNTHRHLCEFTGLDFEMEIKSHYTELTKMLGDLFVFMFDQINANCQRELQAINLQFPFEPLKYKRETLILPFPEAIKLLRDNGVEAEDLADLSTPQEKQLGKIIRQKYDTDFYIIDRYPEVARPFYTMLDPNDPNYTNSYDVFLRGEEITSGAQRVHDAKLLVERATAKGIPLSNIASYVESFKYGAYPHGGAGIGLERVVMLFCGLDNIRKTSMFPRTPNRFAP